MNKTQWTQKTDEDQFYDDNCACSRTEKTISKQDLQEKNWSKKETNRWMGQLESNADSHVTDFT